MTGWVQFAAFLRIVMSYYTLQLGRGAVVSAALLGLILLFRKLWKETVFLKGLSWSILLLALFVGRLRLFYELPFLPFRLWILLCMQYPWVCGSLYFAGCFITLAHICRERRHICHFVKDMRKKQLGETEIHVCESPVTPFTVGVFSPRIVLPAFMLEQYERAGLEMIVLHEKMHIRLGHLLFYLAWDVLHILFWINPLFTLCLKYFKEDMEDICDRVTIQKSGQTARFYGSLLLKSVRGLRDEQGGTAPAATFAGDREYQALKRRIMRVAQFRAYRKTTASGMTAFTALLLFAALVALSSQSYARCEANESVELYNADGSVLLVEDSEELRSAIRFDDYHLFVRGDLLRPILERRGIDEPEYAVSFGGWFKLPGYGGGFCCEFIDREMLDGALVQVPYQKPESPYLSIFLLL